jgi:multidrug efflux pump subunit AcrA (membrane-fusion protein)
MKRIIPLMLILILLATSSGCVRKQGNTAPELITPVKLNLSTYNIAKTTFVDGITQYTSASYSDFYELSFPGKKQIFLKRYVYVGKDVAKGELLAETDTFAVQESMKTIALELAKAKIDVRELVDGLKDQFEIDKAQLVVDDLNNQMRALQKQIDSSKLYSPVNGTVIYMVEKISAGNLIPDGQTYIKIVNRDKVTVELSIKGSGALFTSDLTFAGAAVQMTVNDIPTDATIRLALPDEKTLYPNKAPDKPVFVEPAAGGPGLKVGDLVKVAITMKREPDVFTLPTYIIKTVNNEPYVRVLAADGTFIDKKITLGDHNAFETVITAGLSEGDKVLYK